MPELYWPVYSAEACFKGQKFVEVEVLAVDLRRDLALLKIPQSVLGSDGSQNHVGKILERELMIGEPLYLMGHPHGLPYCTRFRIFSSYRSPKEFSEAMQVGLPLASPPNFPDDFKYLEIDIEAPSDFSGGLVCTGDGYLAGILVVGLDASSNCEGAISCLAVPATHLQRLLLFLE
ncbi:hypothetical protein RHGRI_025015 [Rhododendron griersonianum]|uniref:Uncharacterized protein n=1 Tax=Rhododendron griersonianum TaxID=479676 RepID=A0AAV6JEV2_9ERIC|nr:hypothetical protein RHGRI_025015 [Rhododendron griersonianum]